MIRELRPGEELDLGALPAPFPGWARHSRASRREALWERWSGRPWEVLVAAGDPPNLVAGRLGGDEATVRFWGGVDLPVAEAAAAVEALLPAGPWWAGYSASSPALADALGARGSDGGTICEFLLDLGDVPLAGDEMSSRVAPLAPADRRAVLDLLGRAEARTRWERVGDPLAPQRLEAALDTLAAAGSPPLGAWRGESLVGLAHMELWSERLEVWKVTLSALDPELPAVMPVLQDLWLGWEGRLGRRLGAIRVAVPAVAEKQVALVARAGPSSLWLRRVARGMG